MDEIFRKTAAKVSTAVGSGWAFMTALAIIVVWLVAGPASRFSDTWQLIINTGTTIVTFLMVFLIQNTQNRESVATQLKLDELIRAVKGARTGMLDLEDLSDDELKQVKKQFDSLAHKKESESGRKGSQRK